MPSFTLTQTELTLEKRVPLTISRGTYTHSQLLWLRLFQLLHVLQQQFLSVVDTLNIFQKNHLLEFEGIRI